MSSDKNSITNEQEWQMLGQALSNVLQTMSGLEAEIAFVQPADGPLNEIEFSGFMVMTRVRPSVLTISATRPAIMTILSYMTGEMPDELSEQELNDGVCELVNMVAGEVKSRLNDSERAYGLTSPIAAQGSSLRFSLKNGLETFDAFVTVDGLHLKMSLYML